MCELSGWQVDVMMLVASLVAIAGGAFVVDALKLKVDEQWKGWDNERRRSLYGGLAVVAGVASYGVLLATGLNMLQRLMC